MLVLVSLSGIIYLTSVNPSLSAGIEKEYEQRVLPDGKLNVDGFLCVFDVSQVPNRSLDRQVDLTASILNNCLKTKRPVVLVTTKNDEANEVSS